MVADNVMVAFLGVKLDRKASNIANCVRVALLTTCGAESEKDWCLFAIRVQELGTSQFRNVLVGYFEFTPSTRRFGVDDSI